MLAVVLDFCTPRVKVTQEELYTIQRLYQTNLGLKGIEPFRNPEAIRSEIKRPWMILIRKFDLIENILLRNVHPDVLS